MFPRARALFVNSTHTHDMFQSFITCVFFVPQNTHSIHSLNMSCVCGIRPPSGHIPGFALHVPSRGPPLYPFAHGAYGPGRIRSVTLVGKGASLLAFGHQPPCFARHPSGWGSTGSTEPATVLWRFMSASDIPTGKPVSFIQASIPQASRLRLGGVPSLRSQAPSVMSQPYYSVVLVPRTPYLLFCHCVAFTSGFARAGFACIFPHNCRFYARKMESLDFFMFSYD